MLSGQAKLKAKSAVVGALVADAATMGLHWIYDTSKLSALLEEHGRRDAPEFFEPPSCPFYEYPSGQLSPYGHEALGALNFLATSKQKDPEAFSKFLYAWYKAYSGRLNHTAKLLIENIDEGKEWPFCGADDSQANAMVKAAIVGACDAGSPTLPIHVEEAVRVQQNNDLAAAIGVTAAKILEKVMMGDSISESLQWAATSTAIPAAMQALIHQALQQRGQPYADVVKANGLSCALPGAFVNSLVAASSGASYETAIRDNLTAGGDNCSRALFIGALIAAQDGEAVIPQDWRKKTTDYPTILQLAESLWN